MFEEIQGSWKKPTRRKYEEEGYFLNRMKEGDLIGAKKEAERLKKFGFEGADTLIEEVRLKIKKSGSRIKETLSEDAINWAKDGNTNKAEERITQLKDLGFEKEADTLSEKVSLLLELHEKKTKN